MEPRCCRAIVAERPAALRWQIGIAAFGQRVCLACHGDGNLTLNNEQHTLRAFIQLGTVAAAAWLHFHDVLREGLGKARKGRAITQSRVLSQKGRKLVTISLNVPFGITA